MIDGVWSTVGSANLDWRSFAHNDELNAVVLGPEFGEQMEAMFQKDLANSDHDHRRELEPPPHQRPRARSRRPDLGILALIRTVILRSAATKDLL